MPARIPWCESERIEVTWVMSFANEFQEIIYIPAGDYLILRGKTVGTYDQSGMCYMQTQYFVPVN